MLNQFVFRKIDNAALILFRIFFGLLVAAECYGAIITGWIKNTLINPKFTFNFIGFDFIQPLPGYGMYFYFFVMGSCGILIALGYRYRISIISFTLLWTGVYLMQKTSYNNHYYLLILISFFMCFFPANTAYSFDVKRNPSLKTNGMYNGIRWLIILQLFIVYTFASIAKLYGDWFDLSIIKILMSNKKEYFLIGELLQSDLVHHIIAYFGIAFDLLVIPALLYKPTRKIAFVFAIFFHVFNSVVFQIGIFPYLSLAFTVFFFEPDTIRNIFLKQKEAFEIKPLKIPSYHKMVLAVSLIYLFIQLILPIRHYFIKDDVLWTEEGHRMSWRMMLRSRAGTIKFKVVDKATKIEILVKPKTYLSAKQSRRIASYPDFIWQFAQRLKKDYASNGQDVAVYAINSKVSINGKPARAFINPKVDLANEKWNHFKHHDWIMPSEGSKKNTSE